MVISAISSNWCYFIMNRMNIKIRSGIIALIFNKCLKLSSSSKSKYSSGDIMTLMSVDMERIWYGVLFSHWIWIGPVCLVGAIISISFTVGWIPSLVTGIANIGWLFLFYILGKLIGIARVALVKETENRMKLINESLLGIRVVKMYAWEDIVIKRINSARCLELDRLSIYLSLRTINTVASFMGKLVRLYVKCLCCVWSVCCVLSVVYCLYGVSIYTYMYIYMY